VVREVGRRGPGSLLNDVYKVIHTVRIKGNFKCKISVYIISKSPNPSFLRRGRADGVGFRMHGYKNWRMIRGYIKASFRLDAMRRDPLRDNEVKEVGDFPSVTGSLSRYARGDLP
jgi:hypothetical protein